MLNLAMRLISNFSGSLKRKIVLLLVLMVSSSFLEIFSIGAVIPFTAVLLDPTILTKKYFIVPQYEYFRGLEIVDLRIAFTCIFILVVSFAGFARYALFVNTIRVGQLLGGHLNTSLFSRLINAPYLVQKSRSHSDINDLLFSRLQSVIYDFILAGLQLLASLIFIPIVIIFFLILSGPVFIPTVIVLTIIYSFILFIQKRTLKRCGILLSESQAELVSIANEVLPAYKDIIIENQQWYYISKFEKVDQEVRKLRYRLHRAGGLPRVFLEPLGIVSISVYFFYQTITADNPIQTVTALAAIALAAQRTLPALQSIYSSWTLMTGATPNLIVVLRFLEQPIYSFERQACDNKREAIQRPQTIEFSKVSFRYPSRKRSVISEVNFNIPCGTVVSVTGKSGVGKSTLIDLMMGLLSPDRGAVLVNGVPLVGDHRGLWFNSISHVPQTIHIRRATLTQNIIGEHGVTEVDSKRLNEIIVALGLESLLDTLHSHSDLIDDRMLSGGQRQRIAIARCLYRNASVIFLDEATNALDAKAQREILSALRMFAPNLTLIVIAHDVEIIDVADIILEVSESGVRQIPRKCLKTPTRVSDD